MNVTTNPVARALAAAGVLALVGCADSVPGGGDAVNEPAAAESVVTVAPTTVPASDAPPKDTGELDEGGEAPTDEPADAAASEAGPEDDDATTAARVLAAELPSLCGHEPATLVNGEHPSADPGYLTLSEPVARLDLDADGRRESLAILDCSAGGVAFPSSLALLDDDHSFVAEFQLDHLSGVDGTWRGGIGSVRIVDGEVVLVASVETSGTTPTTEVLVTVHSASCASRVDVDLQALTSTNPTTGEPCDPGRPVAAAALVEPADCVAQSEFNPFASNPAAEVASYQLALRTAGFYAGPIDGEYDDALWTAGLGESMANGDLENRPEGIFAEIFPDDSAILRGAFERLGIACAATVASEPAPAPTTTPPPAAVDEFAAPSVSEATDFVRRYLLAAGARDYPGAWALLSSGYQAKYGGFDSFAAFWDAVALTGFDAVRDLGSSGATRTLELDIWFDLLDGMRSNEVVHIDVTRGSTGDLITDYRFIRIR